MIQGTPPFIANAVLLSTQLHAGKHDLESIFYSLLYALTTFKGPGQLRNNYSELSSVPIFNWFNHQILNHSFKEMGRLRMGHLADFQGSIIKKISKYFSPLLPFLQELFVAFFPDRDYLQNNMTHAKMIQLFNKQYEQLRESEEKAKTSVKRRRFG